MCPFPFDLLSGLSNPPQFAQPNRNDLVDPVSGVLQGARFINLQTGDYQVDPNGHFVGMNDVEQKVQLALLTTFGSATSPIGNTLSRILLITPNIVSQVRAAINAALANLLNSNQITYTKSLTVVKQPMGRVNITVYWKNLITQQSFQNTISLGKSI